jgi:hypothetical protein
MKLEKPGRNLVVVGLALAALGVIALVDGTIRNLGSIVPTRLVPIAPVAGALMLLAGVAVVLLALRRR